MKILIKLFIVFVLSSINAYAALPMAVDGQALPTLAPMLERVQGAIVNISTESHVRVRSRSIDPFFDDPFFRRFFDVPNRRSPKSRKRQGLGSGVIFDAEKGHILTNAHVIHRADKITVTLKDGREFEAEVVGSDKESDVAVIRIEATGITEIPTGDSDQLRVGDFVVAIGNPFGLRQTVTSGIVSALGRSGLGIEGYEDFIQTDASINPGNSGGALVNLRGELIGINTAILAPSGGNVGIGFAIPINMALQLKNQLVEFGKVRRGKIGVHIQDLTPELAEAFNIQETKGAVITKVEEGSRAHRAGIEAGDVVTGVNGKAIDNGSDLRNEIGLLRVGEEIKLSLLRAGKAKTIKTDIGDINEDAADGNNLNAKLEGATFSELTDQQLSSSSVGGILVAKVEQGSAAYYHGLRAGDIILSANRQPVSDFESFRKALKGHDVLLMNIQRGDGALFLLLQ